MWGIVDGYEWMEHLYGRDMIVIPIAIPDFMIERKLGYSRGFMGANFWYMCRSKEAVINAGKKALKAIWDAGELSHLLIYAQQCLNLKLIILGLDLQLTILTVHH